ncbi:fam-c protein [Plasmodium vinckei brucechwatti]|uniref:Fam-c protein n=1 Tax=Plasmodium vinckei brucechwatti TaxID=119398 RepID=A0A6V7SUS9_PLAVN|nr:fam-c protein [Plasmodium vinckei brucechwatti]
MNKNIFSLVCIALYALLDASIYCSEQKSDQSKTYGLRGRIVRAIKKINGSNKKNVIESQRETQSNNNNNNDDDDDDDDGYTYDNYKGYEVTTIKWWGCCGNKHDD